MDLNKFVELAIAEDIRDGDHTSLACIPAGQTSRAKLLVKDHGIIAGVEVAEALFKGIDPELQMEVVLQDGAVVKHGDVAFYVTGQARNILMAERLVLNMMQRMSGVATITNKFVKAVQGTNAKILDTRKTTPLLRQFEKMAVRIGGGVNHRFGLFDMIMIKDNHIAYAGGVEQAITRVTDYLTENSLKLNIEIEAGSLGQIEEIMAVGGVDRIMIDNFSPEGAKAAVSLINGRYETEVSGGVVLENVRAYAESGCDFISVGALTHSVKSLDLSLKAV
ncbi:carboxylating nicotinate-nucleotide diphosphorylase [soil metagenome]